MLRAADFPAALVAGILAACLVAGAARADDPTPIIDERERAAIREASNLRSVGTPGSIRSAVAVLERLVAGPMSSDDARSAAFERLAEYHLALGSGDAAHLDQAIAFATNVLLVEPQNIWVLTIRCESYRRAGLTIQAQNDCDLARSALDKAESGYLQQRPWLDKNLRQVQAQLMHGAGRYEQVTDLLTSGAFAEPTQRD